VVSVVHEPLELNSCSCASVVATIKRIAAVLYYDVLLDSIHDKEDRIPQ
jgi:hypothetical protein